MTGVAGEAHPPHLSQVFLHFEQETVAKPGTPGTPVTSGNPSYFADVPATLPVIGAPPDRFTKQK